MKSQIRNLLGLAMKAGKVVSGEDACRMEIKKNKVYLIIVAKDASENTKKVFSDKSSFRSIPIRFTGNKEELGNSIGKNKRAVIGIKDQTFSRKLLEYIDEDITINI